MLIYKLLPLFDYLFSHQTIGFMRAEIICLVYNLILEFIIVPDI